MKSQEIRKRIKDQEIQDWGDVTDEELTDKKVESLTVFLSVTAELWLFFGERLKAEFQPLEFCPAKDSRYSDYTQAAKLAIGPSKVKTSRFI
jgi:hypothetical protein